ncbi:MAG: hypothetical protein ACR2MT_16325 [Aurantibacter sp.]
MKKITIIFLFAGFFVLGTLGSKAQDNPKKKFNNILEEEEEGPLMYKFEPDFLTTVEQRKAEIKRTRAILDTLDISERKRKRLLRDLYKNGISDRLSKALLVETKFEDEDVKEN